MNMRRTVPVLAAALLLAAGGAWASPPTEPNDTNAGERGETPRAEPREAPSEPPAPAEPTPQPPADTNEPNRQPPTAHGGGGHGRGYGNGNGGGIVEDGYDGDGYDRYGSQGAAFSLPPPPPGGYSGSLFHGGARRRAHDGMGALDLDLKPGRAEVFLNGQRIGTADDFDGWPGYLWLPAGAYDLVFYLDGFQTLGRQVTVRQTLVIEMDDRLQPGPAIRPEDFQLEE